MISLYFFQRLSDNEKWTALNKPCTIGKPSQEEDSFSRFFLNCFSCIFLAVYCSLSHSKYNFNYLTVPISGTHLKLVKN